MAEPTDINKNMSTAEKIIRDGTIDIRDYMDIPYIPEKEEFLFKAFGGKPGQGKVKTPKRLTVEQAIAFLDYSGYPLANENTKFSIVSAIKNRAPELFDDKSFEAYEQKYGSIMEMQEKGGLASKYIETAKESTPANDPKPTGTAMTKTLTEIEFVEKLKAGTATVEEAIDFAQSRPTVSKSAKQRINALKSGFKKMGLDITMPYKDLKDEATLKLFTREGSPDKSNRAGNLQALENNVRDLFDKYAISGLTEKVPGSDLSLAMYPQLTGAGTVAGTQRTGLAGERPMRGNFRMEDFTKIYAEAIPVIEQEYGQATADLIKYHATTANRPEQLQGLKKSDVTISGNQITVAGKTATKLDKKGRPPLTFNLDTPTGQLLKRNLESSKSQFLFDTTDDAFTQAFNKHVGTKLEKFSDILPVADSKVEGPGGVEIVQKPVTTPSAIRSIVPNIMLEQFNIPDALVQGAMGHVNSTILRKNYAGFSPSTDLPKLLENPSSFAKGNFGVTEKNVNLDLLSDEEREAIAKEQKATLLAEDEARRATAVATIAEREAAAVKAKAAVTPEDIAKAEQVEEEMVRAKERRRIREQEIRAEERAKAKAQTTTDLTNIKSPDDFSDSLKEKLRKLNFKPLLKAVPAVGAVPAFMEAQEAGAGPLEAAGRAVLEEATLGIPEALPVAEQAVKAAAEPVTEEIKRQVPQEGFVSGLTRAMTGQGMSGFINR